MLTKILTKTARPPTAINDARALPGAGVFRFAAAHRGPRRPAAEPVEGL